MKNIRKTAFLLWNILAGIAVFLIGMYVFTSTLDYSVINHSTPRFCETLGQSSIMNNKEGSICFSYFESQRIKWLKKDAKDHEMVKIDYITISKTAESIPHYAISIGRPLSPVAYQLNKKHPQADHYFQVIQTANNNQEPLKITLDKKTAVVIKIEELNQEEMELWSFRPKLKLEAIDDPEEIFIGKGVKAPPVMADISTDPFAYALYNSGAIAHQAVVNILGLNHNEFELFRHELPPTQAKGDVYKYSSLKDDRSGIIYLEHGEQGWEVIDMLDNEGESIFSLN